MRSLFGFAFPLFTPISELNRARQVHFQLFSNSLTDFPLSLPPLLPL